MLVKFKSYLPHGASDSFEAYPERVYRCKLDGSEQTLLWEGLYYFISDEQYIYRRVVSTENREANRKIEICGQDGTQLDMIDMGEIGDVSDVSFHVSTGSRVLVEACTNNGGKLRYGLYWFDKSEIGSGAAAIHPFFDYGISEYSDSGRP